MTEPGLQDTLRLLLGLSLFTIIYVGIFTGSILLAILGIPALIAAIAVMESGK